MGDGGGDEGNPLAYSKLQCMWQKAAREGKRKTE